MVERAGQIGRDLKKEQVYLKDETNYLVAHVVVEHHGIPPTSCHRCMSTRQHILSAENEIKRLEQDLSIPPSV